MLGDKGNRPDLPMCGGRQDTRPGIWRYRARAMRHTWAVSDRAPAFACDAATAAYYEQRAKEYDEWYLAQGRFASLNPPGWHLEVSRLVDLVGGLPTARTLD